MKVYCYAIPHKAKSQRICRAFAEGCGGTVVDDDKLRPGIAFFYGVMEGNQRAWEACQQEGMPYLFSDNSYFDQSREQYFRITRNALQHSGLGETDGERFAALDIPIRPWTTGEHIVICPQSEHFMTTHTAERNWTIRIVEALRKINKRPIRVRPWDRNKTVQSQSLQGDLANAHALITWTSAAAITAVMQGVPAACMGECAASPMTGDRLEDVENLPMRSRERWAGVLADNQWSLAEMRNGVAWEALR